MELPAVTAWADTTETRGDSPIETRRKPAGAAPRAPVSRAADGSKVGRNDPCPCGSGKKYKKCCYLKGA
jgi:uncharacterized protein YecA (UPF0149 family)